MWRLGCNSISSISNNVTGLVLCRIRFLIINKDVPTFIPLLDLTFLPGDANATLSSSSKELPSDSSEEREDADPTLTARTAGLAWYRSDEVMLVEMRPFLLLVVLASMLTLLPRYWRVAD